MTPLKTVTELGIIAVVSAATTVPWDGTPTGCLHDPMFPPDIVCFAAIGAGLAVCMIPVNCRTIGIVITTAVVGVLTSLLCSAALTRYYAVESVEYIRAIAGGVAFAAMPICGLFLRTIDRISNSENAIGALMDFFYSRGRLPTPPVQPPSTGRAVPPEGGNGA